MHENRRKIDGPYLLGLSKILAKVRGLLPDLTETSFGTTFCDIFDHEPNQI